MNKYFILILLPFSLIANNCELSDSGLELAAKIRELPAKSKVQCEVVSKDKVRKFLEDSIDKKIAPEKLRSEELIFKSFGFIPEHLDYRKLIVDLYTNEIGGYYDPETKKYYMADWIPGEMQLGLALHELTHALQDQYFDLKKILDPKRLTSDQQMAYSALAEGDATAVMIDYYRKLASSASLAVDQDLGKWVDLDALGSVSIPNAPKAISHLITFPYISGLKFVHNTLKTGGYASVTKVFEKLPRSSEEVIHPEKYLKAEADFVNLTEVDLEKIINKDIKVKYQDTYGEVGIQALLLNFTEEKKDQVIDIGWGGDLAVITEDNQIFWLINWDQEKNLNEFLIAYKAGLQKLGCKLGDILACNGNKIIFTKSAQQLLIEVRKN